MQEFQEGLGRGAFVCGALEYDRPFLAPLYALAARHAPQSVKPLSLYVVVTLEYQSRHCACALQRRSWKEAWREWTHMRTRTVWEWVAAGRKQTRMEWSTRGTYTGLRSKSHQKTPWAFQREGKAHRMITTLEALGLLLALLAFGPNEHVDDMCLTVQVPPFTDNKGNDFVVNKLMTTKFPLCAFVMELAAQAEARGVKMEAEWTPGTVARRQTTCPTSAPAASTRAKK